VDPATFLTDGGVGGSEAPTRKGVGP
jgi:hypothetical protein